MGNHSFKNIFFSSGCLVWLSLLAFTLTPLKAFGVAGPKAPLEITADFAKMNHATGIGVFEGNVVLNQGKNHLTTNKLTIYTDKKKHLVKAIAKGAPAHYWSNANPQKPEFHARALSIEYYAKNDSVVLLGEAVAKQGVNSFSGPRIVYNRKTQVVTSYQSKSARTEIVLIPKTLPGLKPPSGKSS